MIYICKKDYDFYLYKGVGFKVIPRMIRDGRDYYLSWLKYELILSINTEPPKKKIHYE